MEESRTKGALLAEEISKGTAKRDAMDVSIEQERAKQLALYEQINALTSKDEVNRERMSAIVAGHQRLTEEIEVLSQKIAAEKESSSDLFKEKDAVTVQLDQLTSALGEKMKVYVGQNKELSRQVQEIDEQKNKIFGLQSKISGKKAEIASISALKDTLEKRKEQILHERETGGGGESALAQELEQRQQKQALLHQELYALKQEKNLQKQQFSERFQQERELGKELEQLQVNVGQLSARKKTFEEMEGNYDGYNHGVKFIMKENLPGINGVVTELITVPSGFELAMETALGGNIQNIICEGDQVAKAAPDGYTLGFSAISPLVLSPHLGKLPFDPAKDLIPVVSVMYSP
ncbi:MAG: tripartite tricarboxylate transporter substrate-binding protein, partial [Anaerovoracaceae bacterium]